jgi:hypothetical protein
MIAIIEPPLKNNHRFNIKRRAQKGINFSFRHPHPDLREVLFRKPWSIDGSVAI